MSSATHIVALSETNQWVLFICWNAVVSLSVTRERFMFAISKLIFPLSRLILQNFAMLENRKEHFIQHNFPCYLHYFFYYKKFFSFHENSIFIMPGVLNSSPGSPATSPHASNIPKVFSDKSRWQLSAVDWNSSAKCNPASIGWIVPTSDTIHPNSNTSSC